MDLLGEIFAFVLKLNIANEVNKHCLGTVSGIHDAIEPNVD